MKRVHLIISGRVQGVFFRHTTNITANRLGLKGFVRNLPDGNVEVVAEGSEERLKELVEFCRHGPEGAQVDNVETEYQEPKKGFETFSIRF
ncbi:acylphosphatase [Candidatus Woesearchaeota archaeon]|nr:acylphosphatase [Candidatus Woesearchaeota archaeon]